MQVQQINRVSGKILIVLAAIALVTVITGYFQRPLPDEGTAAHIFQLAVLAVVPTLLVFLATADWKRRWQSARPLLVAIPMLVAAFGALYYLEHYWYRMVR